MGLYRRYFRPDQQPSKRTGWFMHGASTSNQEIRKTHNRRQRVYNREAIARELEVYYEGEESDRQGSAEPPP